VQLLLHARQRARAQQRPLPVLARSAAVDEVLGLLGLANEFDGAPAPATPAGIAS
jgi:hypothetical protein